MQSIELSKNKKENVLIMAEEIMLCPCELLVETIDSQAIVKIQPAEVVIQTKDYKVVVQCTDKTVVLLVYTVFDNLPRAIAVLGDRLFYWEGIRLEELEDELNFILYRVGQKLSIWD